jgi:hypothetical protein
MMRAGSKKSLKMKCPDGIIIHDRKNGVNTVILSRMV